VGHKISSNIFKIIEIVRSLSFDYHGTKLEIISEKVTEMWELNMSLNNSWIKEEITRGIRISYHGNIINCIKRKYTKICGL
jgi:hypothetical protein